MRSCMDWRSVCFDWNRARAFLVTAEEGTFSAAARSLGLSQPTVGRQVSALEQQLGVVLFERLGPVLRLTPAGLELVEHVRAMGEAATRVSLSATGQALSIDGTVCITASEVVTTFLLPPVVRRVRAEHPGIELELVASNSARDLRRREADIAIRNFTPRQPELIARKIKDSHAWMYAAPAYLERLGSPRHPRDLAEADFFSFDRTDTMRQGLAALGLDPAPRSFPIITDNHLVQWELCRQGLGICMMMEEIGDPDPAVVRVLPDQLASMPIPVWLTCHRELRTSRRIRAVFDTLAEELAAPPP